MALGADASRVRLMVLRQVAVITLIGSALGLIAAWAVGRVMGSVLYQVEGADPIVFAAAFAVLSTFALAAGYFPALRASRVDPLSALRYDWADYDLRCDDDHGRTAGGRVPGSHGVTPGTAIQFPPVLWPGR